MNQNETRSVETITFTKTVWVRKLHWKLLASEEVFSKQSLPGYIRLFAWRSLQLGPSTWLFEPCTPTILPDNPKKPSMSHQNILHHLISKVSSISIKELIMFESSKNNAPPRMTSWFHQSWQLSSKWPPWVQALASNTCPSANAFWKQLWKAFQQTTLAGLFLYVYVDICRNII